MVSGATTLGGLAVNHTTDMDYMMVTSFATMGYINTSTVLKRGGAKSTPTKPTNTTSGENTGAFGPNLITIAHAQARLTQ